MNRLAAILAAMVLAGPALAEPQSEVLFSHKAWQVLGVAFDDGSVSCEAEVSDPGESFSMWIHQDGSVQLVFFSSQWDFGEGDTANLQVEIDRRVLLVQVDGRRNHAVVQRENGENSLHPGGGAEQVTGHGFG